MLYSKMVQIAMLIACESHKHQKDYGGFPYVFHSIHIAEQMETEDEIIVALLHDVLEDDKEINQKTLVDKGISEDLVKSLILLKHKRGIPYIEYIEKIKADPIARKVKIADLQHNSDLSRLPEITEADIKRTEKYKKAIKILESDT